MRLAAAIKIKLNSGKAQIYRYGRWFPLSSPEMGPVGQSARGLVVCVYGEVRRPSDPGDPEVKESGGSEQVEIGRRGSGSEMMCAFGCTVACKGQTDQIQVARLLGCQVAKCQMSNAKCKSCSRRGCQDAKLGSTRPANALLLRLETRDRSGWLPFPHWFGGCCVHRHPSETTPLSP